MSFGVVRTSMPHQLQLLTLVCVGVVSQQASGLVPQVPPGAGAAAGDLDDAAAAQGAAPWYSCTVCTAPPAVTCGGDQAEVRLERRLSCPMASLHWLLAYVGLHRPVLKRMLDEQQFLSQYGLRSLSKEHEAHPYVFNRRT